MVMCSWKPHVCAVSPAESSLMEQVERILWAGAGAPEGVHAGGGWGPMARRRRRFFRFFSFLAIFYLFSWEFGGHAITPCDSLSAQLTVP